MKPAPQGRDKTSDLDELAACFGWVADHWLALFTVILFAFLLAGCATINCPPTYKEGNVTYHPDDLSACEHGASGCTVWGKDVINVYYSTFYPSTLEHERDHVNGMMHGPWVRKGDHNCAQVTVAGKTKWRVGEWICRDARGEFMKA